MVRQNILANMVGRIWGIVSVYLFIPLYLKFLGIEAYGMVGFYSTLVGVLAFADLGLTATLSREMARLSVKEDAANELRDLVRTYEAIYLCISLVLATVIWFTAPLVAQRWLKAITLQHSEITSSIRLMGIAIALQLPAGLFIGGLIGLQKQVLTNIIQIVWGLFRGLGAALILWLISPTIYAFAFWQLFSNAIYCYAARRSLWRVLPSAAFQPRFNPLVFRGTWRYTAGIAGMAFLSAILIQTDKLVVSKILPLETFGYYMLASALAMGPAVLAGPIGSAVFPRMTGLVAKGDQEILFQVYHKACRLVSVAVIPGALTLALFSRDFLLAWAGPSAAQKAGLTASLLLGGAGIQALLIIPFYLALANGNTKLNLSLGLISVILITPLLISLIHKYGAVGGGISWLVMNVCTLPPYMYFFHRRFINYDLKKWVLYDVGRPLLASLPIILLGRLILPTASSRVLIFSVIGLVWGLSAVTAVVTLPDLRNEFFMMAKKFGPRFKESDSAI